MSKFPEAIQRQIDEAEALEKQLYDSLKVTSPKVPPRLLISRLSSLFRPSSPRPNRKRRNSSPNSKPSLDARRMWTTGAVAPTPCTV